MKTARKIVRAYELFCPHCNECLPSKLGVGSLFWTVEEIEPGKVEECPFCEKKFKLPKS